MAVVPLPLLGAPPRQSLTLMVVQARAIDGACPTGYHWVGGSGLQSSDLLALHFLAFLSQDLLGISAFTIARALGLASRLRVLRVQDGPGDVEEDTKGGGKNATFSLY